MKRKILNSPLFWSIVSVILYVSGFVLFTKNAHSELEKILMMISRSAIQIVPCLIMIVYSIGYKHDDDSMPRSAVFAVMLGSLLGMLICRTLDIPMQTLGAYSLLHIMGIEESVSDTAMVFVQILFICMMPFIKGLVMRIYSCTMCGWYLLTIILRVIFFFTGDITPRIDVMLFLLSAVAFNYTILLFARDFNYKNIGGCWECLIEDFNFEDSAENVV